MQDGKRGKIDETGYARIRAPKVVILPQAAKHAHITVPHNLASLHTAVYSAEKKTRVTVSLGVDRCRGGDVKRLIGARVLQQPWGREDRSELKGCAEEINSVQLRACSARRRAAIQGWWRCGECGVRYEDM